MKTVIQNYRNGKMEVAEIPSPAVREGCVLVRNAASLVSSGTERSMVELAKKNLLGKARARPDLVLQVLEKAKRDGILSAIETARSRLDKPLPMGYSCAGLVEETGESVYDLVQGDRVACAGAGHASHAEVVCVPKNLCARIPESVSFEEAAFSTLGAVALQGLRLAEVRLGECVAVIGLGLVGLIGLQLAKASGCRVIGMDPDRGRCEIAKQLGSDFVCAESAELLAKSKEIAAGHGVDAVLITADTRGNEPVELAGEIARDRALVVAVGSVGMDIPRRTYYEKELSFRVSRSYGPGRYDVEYEEKGRDYPIGYVRWTEKRNMEAFLQQLAEKKVDVKPLITHRFPIDEAKKAYDLITGREKRESLGILLTYPVEHEGKQKPVVSFRGPHAARKGEGHAARSIRMGMLGAGQFAQGTLIPAMKKVSGIELVAVCTATGVTANHVGKKFGFQYCTTNEREILRDPDIDTVVVATRHHLHAGQVMAALQAGKHVFCEKPLCIHESELDEILSTLNQTNRTKITTKLLMVGYNRRFSSLAVKLKGFFAEATEPVIVQYRVNAGYIPPDHWVQDPEQGGGRIVGEVCHFVDFLCFLIGSMPVRVYASGLPNNERYRDDNLVVTIEFPGGSIGSIIYASNADKGLSKERVEVFGGGAAAVLDNFQSLSLMRAGKHKMYRSRFRQDKGHRGEWVAFLEAVKSGNWPIPLEEIISTTKTTFAIRDSLRSGRAIELPWGTMTPTRSAEQGTGEKQKPPFTQT